MKNLFLLIVFCCLTYVGVAQDKSFTIVALKGGATANGKALKIGQQLDAKTTVLVSDNTYLGLLHKSGKPVEFKASGSFELKPINDQLASGKNFQEKYMNYVVSNLSAKNDGKFQKNMAITGSVERAIKNSEIIVPLPYKTTLINKRFELEWLDNKDQNATYEVQVKNMKEESVFSQTTANTKLLIDLSKVDFEKEQYYIVSVRDLTSKRNSNTVNLYVPSDIELNILLDDLTNAKAELDLTSPIGQLALAKVCEARGLHIEAVMAYKEAVALGADVDYFATVYQEYLDQIAAN